MIEQSTILKELDLLIKNNTIKLPSLPIVVANIEKALRNDNAGLNEIADVIQTEMTVSSRVLQVSNSPALRGYSKILTIRDAIHRVGLVMVKNIVMTISLRDKFSSLNKELNGYLFQLFECAIETSYLMFQVAKRNKKLGINPDIAHLSGILFNLGKLPVVSYYEYREFSSIDEVEQRANQLRSHFNEVIMSKWEVNASIASAVCKQKIQSVGLDLGDVLLIVDAYLKKDDKVFKSLSHQAKEIWDDIDSNYEIDMKAVNDLKLAMTG